MNRIKIMLTAITVFAVVGGALAFKAKTFSTQNVYCSTFPSPNTCQSIAFVTTPDPFAATSLAPCGTGVKYFTQAGCAAAAATTTTVYTTNIQ